MQYSILQMSPGRQIPDGKDSPTRETQASQSQPVAPDSDASLAARMVHRDPKALEEVYRLYAPRLLTFLTNRLGDRSLAEETLQEVMIAAWRGAPRFRGECRLYTWLLVIARNLATNAYQRQIKPRGNTIPLEEADLLQASQEPASEATLGEYDDLQDALEALPIEQREMLDLVFYHGLSLEETALVLGVPQGTVKSRLHRARQRLRHLMGGQAE